MFGLTPFSARLGSGSASRSIYSGFAEWMPGTRDDGLDSFAVPLDTTWPDFRIGILTLSDAKKSVGSTEGMRRTMETATLYKSWPAQVAKDLPVIREAVRDRDIANLGQAAEQNAMSMHATMIAAWPPVIYWKPESVAALHQVHALRTAGCPVYATMDAGPNVKLIFEAESTAQIQSTFPGVQIVAPFDPAQ
jgi:diphosphomevalonate decarboxylase